MKTTILAALLTALSFSTSVYARGGGGGHGGHSSAHAHSSPTNSGSDHAIRAYTKRDGTYVAPAHATNPNATRNDNYTTRGNINPYTLKPGTKPGDY